MDKKNKAKKNNIIIVDQPVNLINKNDINNTNNPNSTINTNNPIKKRGRKKKILDTIVLSEEIFLNEPTDKSKIKLEDAETNIPNIKIIDANVLPSTPKNSTRKLTRKNSKDYSKVEEVVKKEDTSDENNNILLKELLSKQLKNISADKKLSYNDIIRINKFINVSIFDQERCSLWNGYVTNEKNKTKGTYINFYFNKKKIALHRLLYINYIGEISNEEYIKFSCENKGKCCNINHMKKYLYSKNLNEEDCKESDEEKKIKEKQPDPKLHINTDKKKLIIEF